MGTALWSCRKTKAREGTTSTSDNEENKEEDRNTMGSLATCMIIKIVRQSCMWKTKKKRKNKKLNLHLHSQEKNHNHHHLPSNTNNTDEEQYHDVKLVTLEEWILASPSLNELSLINNNAHEGDSNYNMAGVVCKKMYNSSSRVHPSFDPNNLQGSCHPHFTKSMANLITMERSEELLEEQANPDIVTSSSSPHCCNTAQSGRKIKKKVSFRLPEIADIFLLDSQEGHFENVS